MNALTNLATAVVVAVILFVVYITGVEWGQEHPRGGQVLVPAKTGTPSDLPRWACEELVEYRVAQLHRFEASRARAHHQPFVHYSVPDLRAFLGPKLGVCPR